MAIAVKLDDLLHERRMTLTNLSILKTGKACDPLLDACGDLRGALVPAGRPSPV
jgi:hypothetical protein